MKRASAVERSVLNSPINATFEEWFLRAPPVNPAHARQPSTKFCRLRRGRQFLATFALYAQPTQATTGVEYPPQTAVRCLKALVSGATETDPRLVEIGASRPRIWETKPTHDGANPSVAKDSPTGPRLNSRFLIWNRFLPIVFAG
jgi:hypothetical protein